MLKSIWNSLFVETFHRIESEKETGNALDKKVIIILMVSAFSLLFIRFLGDVRFVISGLESWSLVSLAVWIEDLQRFFPNYRLYQLGFWMFVSVFFYAVIPLLTIKFILKERVTNYGLSTAGVFKSYKIYLLFLAVMIPIVIWVSTHDSFQAKYPFYNPTESTLWPNFFLWECLYLAQFFGLEFFFRGFMLHGLKKKFGYYSIWVMMVPYMMIHFRKPMPEAIAAIFAGIILGTLSLKSKSVWLGVAIHFSVAILMDFMALYWKGFFE